MLRNNLIRQHSKVWYILNEVLSLNAQEYASFGCGRRISGILNEVLSLNAQECILASTFEISKKSSMKS